MGYLRVSGTIRQEMKQLIILLKNSNILYRMFKKIIKRTATLRVDCRLPNDTILIRLIKAMVNYIKNILHFKNTYGIEI